MVLTPHCVSSVRPVFFFQVRMFSEHSLWLLFYWVYLYPCHGMTRIENMGFPLALCWLSKGRQPCLMCLFSFRFCLNFEARTNVLLAAIF